MAKRRPVPGSAAEENADDDRRRSGPRSKRDRERQARSKKPKRTGTYGKLLVPGSVIAAVAVVVLLLIYGTGHLFPAPCLNLGPIPESSGTPAFPNSTTTDFSGTWCPGATSVLISYPSLTITVNGQNVALPPSIGRNSNFTAYTCTLPIETTASSSGLAPDIVTISSPWAYVYTLGDFFSVWADSYTNAHVNASYSTTSIAYTSTSLLGLPVDSGHVLTLFVDNQPNSEGPSFDMDTASSLSNVYPACIASVYGTGHSILLQYKSLSSTAARVTAPPGPALGTADGSGPLVGAEYGSPMPRVTLDPAASNAIAALHGASFAWLTLRVTA